MDNKINNLPNQKPLTEEVKEAKEMFPKELLADIIYHSNIWIKRLIHDDYVEIAMKLLELLENFKFNLLVTMMLWVVKNIYQHQ